MQVVAVVALLEWLGDQCTECRGGVRPGAKVAARDGVFWCPACEGLNGVRRMTTTARAIAVGTTLRSWQGTKGKGMDVAIFQEHWARRYEQVLDILTAAERRLARAIDRQLRWAENPRVDTDSGVEQEQPPDDEPDESSGSKGAVRPQDSSMRAA